MTRHGNEARKPATSEGERGGSPTSGGKPTPLTRYAKCMGMSIEQLRALGVTEIPRHILTDGPAVKIAYRDRQGQETTARFVHVDTGEHAWRSKNGGEAAVYGLDRLTKAGAEAVVVLVRDEHEAIAAHGAGKTTLAVNRWTPDVVELLRGTGRAVAVIADDTSPETIELWRARLPGLDVRMAVVAPMRVPWSSQGMRPRRFAAALNKSVGSAPSLKDLADEAARAKRELLWPSCRDIAEDPHILRLYADTLEDAGVLGVRDPAQLIYLQMTSRLLDRPLSVAVRAVSSAGKSFLVMESLRFFPPSAYWSLTAMSEKALFYTSESLVHRVLVLAEAEGMGTDFSKSTLRSLLSEGRIRYSTVVSVPGEAPQGRDLEIAGPTGLLVTHTKTTLDPELETRLVGITVPDSLEQTQAIMQAQARTAEGGSSAPKDAAIIRPWLDFQEWLRLGNNRVVVPFATTLMELMPAGAIRMRRDFGKVISFIQAHALLQQCSRDTDGQGNIIATVADYAAVRRVFASVLAETVESAVPIEVRATVEAVIARQDGRLDCCTEVTIAELRRDLHLADAPVRRRVALAVELGYLTDRRRNAHAAHALIPGEPMPRDRHALPTTRRLRTAVGGGSLRDQ